jgi:hypothetical protein
VCRRALHFLVRSRQGIQVAKIFVPGLAEVSLRKRESERVLAHAEQHFESIARGVEAKRGYSKKERKGEKRSRDSTFLVT